ncbi:MAG: hypothetical protein M1831_003733 [Alyxoria varia]|nr:MAG: hypothetical protein M1831_003733 [Alyxoria varia]
MVSLNNGFPPTKLEHYVAYRSRHRLVQDQTVMMHVQDVIIVGGGPCGLAIAARLNEKTPSALFTDAEHQRYHWINKHSNRLKIQRQKQRKCTNDTAEWQDQESTRPRKDPGCETFAESRQNTKSDLSMIVLDATADRWMAKWDHLFEAFNIKHLRSPMFFHVDPSDRDSLLSYTLAEGRDKELQEIKGCVGKEISKHKRKKSERREQQGQRAELAIDERDRKDYFTPSTDLFAQHCRYVIHRYGLHESTGLVRKETVEDIDYGTVSDCSDADTVFTVRTNHNTHYARAVVLAVGTGSPSPLTPSAQPSGPTAFRRRAGFSHSFEIRGNDFPAASVRAKIQRSRATTLLIVGGGLTAAQLADLAIKRGVSKVWMVMRGQLKVKPFDFDLEWVGKFKNHEKSVFWSADSDEDRLAKFRSARNGGSITPRYYRLLKQHVAAGRVSIKTNTTLELSKSSYDHDKQSWQELPLEPPLVSQRKADIFEIPQEQLEQPKIDYVYLATGATGGGLPNFCELPFLRTFAAKHPCQGGSVGGLPSLNENMMWCDDVPLFVTGAMAALRLGPGAPNLEGARLGAERIAWGVEEHFSRSDVKGHRDGCGSSGARCCELEVDEVDRENQEARDVPETCQDDYYTGIGNRYEVLGI